MKPEENRTPMTVSSGKPYPLGVYNENGKIRFAAALKRDEDCGLLLYRKGEEIPGERIPLREEHRTGEVYSVSIEGLDPGLWDYNYYCKDQIMTDPYAARIIGREVWGAGARKGGRKKTLKSGFGLEEYPWEGDRPLRRPFDECVAYQIHVRGFTKHISSKCVNRGTFSAVREKIPYLKELGVNLLELTPSYEFEEAPALEEQVIRDQNILEYMNPEGGDKREVRINYWGYVEGSYFAPKASYSAGDPVREFKDMVKELHRNGIELVMQFYFPEQVNRNLILDVIKFWVLEYHIDGVHLLGVDLPVRELATCPVLSDTKLMYESFNPDEIYGPGKTPSFKNLCVYNDAYMYDIRRIIKSDENQLPSFVAQLRRNPEKTAVINYLANYNTFTLMDTVSYDRKHNEQNGEDNRDGSDYNASWNCGVEGATRKKAILSLRNRQIRNALTVLMLSQGTPLLMSGDEFGNSRQGNNNAYCQDNAISWLNWTLTESGSGQLRFVKELIRFRKRHPVLHSDTQMQMMDLQACGYPELSYHGESAWYARFNAYDRHIGIMYSGKCTGTEKEEDDFFYLACNFHWEAHKLALPKLPKRFLWHVAIDTGDSEGVYIYAEGREKALENQLQLLAPPRTVLVLIGRKSLLEE